MRNTTAASLCSAALLASTSALAASAIPVTPGIATAPFEDGEDGFARGATSGPRSTVTFSVPLEAGRDYFVAGVSDINEHVMELRDAGNRVLRTVGVAEEFAAGFEFRPSATGTYFVRFVEPDDRDYYDEEARAGVAVFVGPDCRGGTSTLCRLSLGRTTTGRWDFLTEGGSDGEGGSSEHDYFKVRLTAGRTYTAQLASPDLEQQMRVSFHDRDRRTLASAGVIEQGAVVESVSVRFRPRVTGDYWVRAAGGFHGTRYELLVR